MIFAFTSSGTATVVRAIDDGGHHAEALWNLRPVDRWSCSVAQSRTRLHFAAAGAEGVCLFLLAQRTQSVLSGPWSRRTSDELMGQASQADSLEWLAGPWWCPRANVSRQTRSQTIVVPSS